MQDAYAELDSETLQRLLNIHRHNAAIIAEKIALFGILHTPLHLENELEAQNQYIRKLKDLIAQKNEESEIQIHDVLIDNLVQRIIMDERLRSRIEEVFDEKMRVLPTVYIATDGPPIVQQEIEILKETILDFGKAERQVDQAKRLIIWGVNGLIVMVASFAILNSVRPLMQGSFLGLIASWVNFVILIASFTGLGAILAGGYLYMVAGSTPKKNAS